MTAQESVVMSGGLLGLLFGGSTLCTGIEDDPSGALRMYVGPRYKGIYALIVDSADQEALRHAWAGSAHVVVPTPSPDQLFMDAAPKREPVGESS